ncbi:MAG: flagellar basal body rod protein FlgB [Geminicoccaceae bacterium]|nr:flagellar basal body rod protein FlgB [Geminicoccaceae bacterium]
MRVPAHSPLFALISERARWLGARHTVLAQNVANADTPGYRPSDLSPFERALREPPRSAAPPLVRTSPLHLAGTAPARSADPRTREVGSYEIAPSGNAVVLEEEMQKLAQNQLDHQLATSLYTRHLAMLRTALGTAAS